MNDEPLISVLIVAYNREKYLAQAIESVLASTFTNFELIIVDDCSIDRTLAIAKKFEGEDKRISVYQNKKNIGQFANRNKAAFYAKGYFLKYVDSDDIIYPNTLQFMVDSMMKFPNAALGFCLLNESLNKALPCQIESKIALQQHYFSGGLLFVGPSGLIIKRTAFETVNGFEEFGMPSDNHLSLKIASTYPVVALPKNLFLWRTHEGQVFFENINNHQNILNNYQYSKDIIINYSPLSSDINKRIMRNLHKIFLSHLLRLIFKKGKPGVALNLFLQMQNEKS